VNDVAPLYLQLLGPGTVWIMVHCGGMCGPIVAGLRLGEGGWRRAAMNLALYQSGRAVPLAVAGAIAGAAGAAVADLLADWGPWLTIAIAAAMLVAVAVRLGWLPWLRAGADSGAFAGRLLRPVAGFAGRHPLLGAFAVGAALSVLPCGVVYWILSLSAGSASPLHGALLPVLLVAISTPPLAIAAGAGAATFGRLRSRLAWVPTAALLLSAFWLAMHGLASLEYVPHVHVGKVMLW
jgi:sulfite exporter TauE/SafE